MPSARTAKNNAPGGARARDKRGRGKTPGRGTIWLRRLLRALLAIAIATPLLIGVLWYAIHHVPWLGPWLADEARVVLGPKAVSWLEDRAYRAEDRYNRWSRRGEPPKAHWEVPASSADEPEPEAVADPTPQPDADAGAGPAAGAAPAKPGPWRPANVGPLYREVSARGDGRWVAVKDPGKPGVSSGMYKTLIHADAKRPWAELFVVAMDVRRLRVSLVAGTVEPIASTRAGRAYARKGLVPARDREDLVAAFNGGFKAEHGQLGMFVDGVTLLPAKKSSCTVASYRDGSLRIASLEKLEGLQENTLWWRQGPSCLVEDGNIHPGLENETAMSWGSAVGGDTVIRRSALGLSADGTTLFMGITNYTTARAIALGMKHAGAHDVVQLDVNWSYPHFVLFRRSDGGQREGVLLFEGFVFHKGEYIANATTRDFFYVTRR